ncbi:MAG: glycosyltransferase, partial [Gammaproteobacteria bacterium]
MSLPITALVLTFNEAIHIERCLRSIQVLTHDIIVVDCFSTDTTVNVAEALGAKVLRHEWEGNQAAQINWALTQLPSNTEWVMRIDADEIITSDLAEKIKVCLLEIPN